MSDDPQQWMHASLLDCCKCYFSWNIIGCLGYSDSSTDSLYYPDLYGNSKTCKADGNAPSYMTTNTYSWMYGAWMKVLSFTIDKWE
jgi:hypothetical protein